MKKIFTIISLLLVYLQGFAKLDYSNPSDNDYIGEWGRLKLVGNQLCSEKGEPIQLRGWSTYGYSSEFGKAFDDQSDFDKMKSYGANFARIAQYINEDWTSGVRTDWVKNCIDYCANAKIYCLVDWHILTPGNPNDGAYSGYNNFFNEITSYVKEKGYKHVLYEICNEPNDDVEGAPAEFDYVWDWIKKYAYKVLPIIGQADSDAVVIVGTPQWDLDLTRAFQDPLEIQDSYKDLQIMYSFHHYAGDQQKYLGILSGAAAFVPIFITAWSLSEQDAEMNNDATVNTKAGDHMLAVANGKNLGGQLISWANWSWCESWSENYKKDFAFATWETYRNSSTLSTAGDYVTTILKEGDHFSYCESTPYTEQEFDGVNDFLLDLSAYDKGGQDNGYFDYDEEWACAFNNLNNDSPCNCGDTKQEDFRLGEYVDMGYTDETSTDPVYKSLDYIGNGEWVKYTIDVKIAGDYEFELYSCNYLDFNTFAIAVDGKPGLVTENGEPTPFQALYLTPCKGGGTVSDGANSDNHKWGWVKPTSEYNPSINYRIHFDKAGTHTIAFAFMTTSSGLGSFKIKGNPNNKTGLDLIGNNKVSLWPNPSENGSFDMTVTLDSKVKVLNAQGACVYTQDVKAGKENRFALNLPAGIYAVVVADTAGSSTHKLIVK